MEQMRMVEIAELTPVLRVCKNAIVESIVYCDTSINVSFANQGGDT